MKDVKLSMVTAVMVIAGLMVEASAADLTASSDNPSFFFNDTGYTTLVNEYKWGSTTYAGNTGAIYLRDLMFSRNLIWLQHPNNPDTDTEYALLSNGGDVCLANDALCINRSVNDGNSLVVDTSGNVVLADGSVFIDRANKKMGIGTTTPSAGLHIMGSQKWQYLTYAYEVQVGPMGLWWWKNGGGGLDAVVKFQNNAAFNTLVVGSNEAGKEGNVGIGTADPQAKLDVRGEIKSSWSGSNTAGDGMTSLATLEADNSAADKTSDAGFAIKNKVDNFTWVFRTYSPGEGFVATKLGTGGTEFEVDNTTTDYHNTIVKMGGVVVFKNGHLVDTSGAPLASLVQEQSIKLAAQDKLLAETMAKMEAKDTEIIAMKAKQEAQNKEITQLKTMQKKVAMMESLLTNLALNTSSADKTKVSANLK